MVITGLTRNQFESNLTWVRIPPCPPEQNGHPARGGRFVLAVFSRIRTGAVVNGVPGALQSRDPACSAEQVESCTLRQKTRRCLKTAKTAELRQRPHFRQSTVEKL